MTKTDDIDILLTVHPAGWSTCNIFMDGKATSLVISHVLGNPYYDLVRAMINLINGNREATWAWYEEPDGNQVEVKQIDKTSKVRVSVNSFEETFGYEIKSIEQVLEFDIELKQLIVLFYMQLKKTEILFRLKLYSRSNDFPFHEFAKLEALMGKYLES